MEKNALLQEIIACMAENGDYSQTELDEFCSIFFESIEAGLLADKYVKIKGFGTFKLINVSDRESINVNTGERIQISGHAKASFIPDNDLKDLINSPFAHFQTVAINDETNFFVFYMMNFLQRVQYSGHNTTGTSCRCGHNSPHA